ncbi:hypothetical protein CIW48_27080 [Methylobacterium sp. P1-11]|uniref:hypothetical protein n=1 Tax=Methylobacterium sp. P1-11 TaxID=2024616 RepID=UPI0011F0834F|nr:hypothetical protein [Methylobacterium sp. P1-11]KAA0117869.1 hypothetical protein CIW48_27080 [Methylobacterium sp. P1-11]
MAGNPNIQPGPGRPKGSVNKTTALLKDAILKAAQTAGGGGEDGIANYLADRAIDTPGPFLALLGKVLPMQVTGEDGEAIKTDNTLRLVFMKPGDQRADDHGS